MLDKNQITKIATNLQTTEYNTAEEYCQHIFLSQFYQLPSSERVFFKGGTALRIVFASPRFSEDLDFSSDLMIKHLQPVSEKIQATLTRKNPRDFFDIYFLLRSRLIIPSQKKDLLKIKTLIEKSEINFSRELKQFLPISFHNIIKDFKKTLVNEINRNVA